MDQVEALREQYMTPYTVTLESEEMAKAFAKDFQGVCQGRSVTVSAKRSLEEVFMQYYGGEEHAE